MLCDEVQDMTYEKSIEYYAVSEPPNTHVGATRYAI